MRWWWQSKRQREPSEETQQARAAAEKARERLQAVERDSEVLKRLTARTQREAAKNNFAADIRKALGGTR